MNQNKTTEFEYVDKININELIKPYLTKWKWFVISLIIAVGLLFLYLKKTAPVYEMESTVLIRDVKKSPLDFGMMSELSSLGGRSSSTINNEMELLKSKKLMKEVVERLGIQTRVFAEEGLRKNELFGRTMPFFIKVITEKEISPEEKIQPIYVKISGENLELNAENFKSSIFTTYNKTINLPYANLMIVKNKDFDKSKRKDLKELFFTYTPIDKTVSEIQKSTDVKLVDRDATVIGINIKYANIDKGKAIINTLVNVFNNDAIKDKNSESQKTKEFIDERLSIISEELGNVENQKEQFKTANQITDIPTETQLNLANSAATRNKLIEAETQLAINNDLISYLSKQGSNQVLPSTIGLNNPTASANISTYNNLVMERNRLLEEATPQNPTVIELTKQIANVRSAVMDNLVKNRTSLNEMRVQMLTEQNSLSSKIRKVPAWEKAFRNIERQQSIKENLYLILLQKREETAITLANTTPKAKIVDYAYASEKPIAPKKLFFLIGAITLGLLIPFLLIYLREFLKNKVYSKHDLEKLSKTTILGEIPRLEKNQNELIIQNDLSPVAEAFRIVSTNLSFILPKKDNGKLIFVSSSVKGEGKTFVSVNLALTLSTKKNKVLIIGSDIRNPQLQRYIPEKRTVAGLTEFLYDDKINLKDILHLSQFNSNCDVIYSGSIPPNPAELLANGRLKQLLEEAIELYDFVILDTAPLMLVTDTLLYSEMADATLYVVRSGFTENQLISFANSNIEKDKIKNVGFVLNDVDKDYFGYGNKYGYGYGVKEIPWYSKILDKF